MSNVQISIKSDYREGRDISRPNYRMLEAEIDMPNGNDEPEKLSDVQGTTPVDFVEGALNQVIQNAIKNDEKTSLDVVITGAGLKKQAQTAMSNKFTSDPVVSSIKFE